MELCKLLKKNNKIQIKIKIKIFNNNLYKIIRNFNINQWTNMNNQTLKNKKKNMVFMLY